MDYRWFLVIGLFIGFVLLNTYLLRESFDGSQSRIDHAGVSNSDVFCDRLGHKMCNGARHYDMCVIKVLQKCQDDFMRGKYGGAVG